MKTKILGIFLFALLVLPVFSQKTPIDSIRIKLQSCISDTTRLFLLNDLSVKLLYADSLAAMAKTSETALKLSERLLTASRDKTFIKKIKWQKARACNIAGMYYQSIAALPTAINYFSRAKDLWQELNAKLLVAHMYGNIGVIYDKQGNYTKALESHLQNLHILENINDQANIQTALVNIGLVYEDLDLHTYAYNYQTRALKMARKNRDLETVRCALLNLGFIQFKTHNNSKAIEYFEKCLEICDSTNNLLDKATALNGLGNAYSELGNFSKSLVYYQNAYKIRKATGNTYGVAVSFSSIAGLYLLQKKYNQSLSFYLKSQRLSEEIGTVSLTKTNEENIYQIYELLGNTNKALEHYKKYTRLKDSLFNESKNQQFLQLHNNFEVERREQKINLLEKDRAIKEIELTKKMEEISSQKRQSYIVFFSGSLLFLFLISIVIVYRKKIATEKLLNLKNEEIHRQKITELLKEQSLKSAHELLRGQELERQRIAKDLHDGVGGALAGIKLKMLRLEETLDKKKELHGLIQNVENVYDEIRTISHNLTPPTLKQSVFTDAVKLLVEDLENSSHLKIKLDLISKEKINLLHENIQVEIYRILQELLKNVLLHAKASEVVVDVIKSENELTLLVEDNGKGYTFNSKSVGIGLQNIKSRVERLSGTLSVDSMIGRGTAVNINIAC